MNGKSGPQPRERQPVDWAGMRRRVEEVGSVLAQGAEPTARERRSILKARARELAREPESARPVEDNLAVLEFQLARETYAVESSSVREVYPLRDLAFVPCTPPHVLGVINVRRQIISVIDIKKLFGLPEKGITDLNRVIILRRGEAEVGILGDAILGLKSIPVDDIGPVPDTLTGVRAECLRGVTVDGLIVLDAKHLLTEGEFGLDQ